MRSGIDNLRPMLGDHFHHHHHHHLGHGHQTLQPNHDSQTQHDIQQQQFNHHHHLISPQHHHQHHLDPFGSIPHQFNVHHQPTNLSLDLSAATNRTIAPSYHPHAHPHHHHLSPFTTLDDFDNSANTNDNGSNDDGEQSTAATNSNISSALNRAIIDSYYQPQSLTPTSSSSTAAANAVATSYVSLNQKRESVITFTHNSNGNGGNSGSRSSSITKLYSFRINDNDEDEESVNDTVDQEESALNAKSKMNGTKLLSKTTIKQDVCNDMVLVHDIPLTLDQIICICQVLQKCDLQKLEKFIYNLPGDNDLCNKNELIIRARALAAYHGGNFKQVYELLETNNFQMKYHQELQALWNNAHYKEHEIKRGHPPGAVEKYRIRKKYQFPRTIWDGEEYVYCFKEKNRRILKEFYQKCNLPTQEDKLKLSSETQLTVVQISNWFKNRRQRDRQPHHHHHHHHHGHHHHQSDDQEHHRRHNNHSNGSSSLHHHHHHQEVMQNHLNATTTEDHHQNDKSLSPSNLTDEDIDDDCCSIRSNERNTTNSNNNDIRTQQQEQRSSSSSNNLDLNRLLIDHHHQHNSESVPGFNSLLLNGVNSNSNDGSSTIPVATTAITSITSTISTPSITTGGPSPYYFLHHHHHHQ